MNQTNFLDKARALSPILRKTKISCTHPVDIIPSPQHHLGYQAIPAHMPTCLSVGDSFILDFGDHYTGHLSFQIRTAARNNADSPARLKLSLAEIPAELVKGYDRYCGALSSSWLQEEIITVDVIPGSVTLPRRYSFRYLKLEVVACSPHFKLIFSDFSLEAVSSANVTNVAPLCTCKDTLMQKIDSISIKTLSECMQSVFEDGPKRDRRLWIGDLRLQALTNYVTTKNNDLVKKCLYLFAGLRKENVPYIPPCLYETPVFSGDDYILMDYSMMFVLSVCDYYTYTCDALFAEEMWETVMLQVDWAIKNTDKNGIVIKQPSWWCFIDWNDELEKITSLQGITVYAFNHAAVLAKALGKTEDKRRISDAANALRSAARCLMYDEKENIFYAAPDSRQLSWASQIWMILADVIDKEQSKKLMQTLLSDVNMFEKPVTPYMHHYVLEAMKHLDMKDEAETFIKEYWGAMVKKDADTFWEVFRTDDETLSPYGDWMINSYCHAWSCTPSYFIRTWLYPQDN